MSVDLSSVPRIPAFFFAMALSYCRACFSGCDDRDPRCESNNRVPLQVAALRVLAGLLEASAEGMDAFRVRDGFNVLYHALAQGDDALQQVKIIPGLYAEHGRAWRTQGWVSTFWFWLRLGAYCRRVCGECLRCY